MRAVLAHLTFLNSAWGLYNRTYGLRGFRSVGRMPIGDPPIRSPIRGNRDAFRPTWTLLEFHTLAQNDLPQNKVVGE